VGAADGVAVSDVTAVAVVAAVVDVVDGADVMAMSDGATVVVAAAMAASSADAVAASAEELIQYVVLVGGHDQPRAGQGLARVVRAATPLGDARYGALGVIGADQRLARFITVGLSPQEIEAIGPYPEGHGLLGELIRNPVALRTDELSAHCADLGLTVSEDLGPTDIAVRWFGRPAEELPRAGGHVVVATSA